MLYKNGSIIGVQNAASLAASSGVWDLNAVQQAREGSLWPTVNITQLLESRSTAGSENVWTQSTYSIDGTSIAGTTGRWVVHHRNTTQYTTDVQYDSITLPAAGGNITYDFESGVQGFETTATAANPGQSIVAYSGASFASVITNSGGGMRFNRDSGGTNSTNTGGGSLSNQIGIDHSEGTTSGFYIYYEGSSSGTSTNPGSGMLRSPEVTLASTGTIEWYQSEHGNGLNTSIRDVYWIVS